MAENRFVEEPDAKRTPAAELSREEARDYLRRLVEEMYGRAQDYLLPLEVAADARIGIKEINALFVAKAFGTPFDAIAHQLCAIRIKWCERSKCTYDAGCKYVRVSLCKVVSNPQRLADFR